MIDQTRLDARVNEIGQVQSSTEAVVVESALYHFF